MTSAQRRATKRYRERRRKSGLKRLEVQVPAREAAVIRKAAAILRGEPAEVMRLRAHLGFDSAPQDALTALDIFAMEEPLSPQGEALWEEAMTQIERDRKDPALSRPRNVDL
jgi:hypothetical protein